MTEKTHYRKAFNSPYLSAADITEPTVLTIKKVALDLDKTKKTKERFNTAYFVETEIRSGEPLKPMILNAGNSKTLKTIAGSAFIDDWSNLKVTVFVDPSVRFGKDTVEGLRISSVIPSVRKTITPDLPAWANAKAAYLRDGNLKAVLAKVDISEEHQILLIEECSQKVESA